MGHPAEERIDHNLIGAAIDLIGGLASRAGGLIARIVVTVLLLLILLAVAVEATRSSGWAAPILGR